MRIIRGVDFSDVWGLPGLLRQQYHRCLRATPTNVTGIAQARLRGKAGLWNVETHDARIRRTPQQSLTGPALINGRRTIINRLKLLLTTTCNPSTMTLLYG
jgi:hypothetical protein